jgi:rhodanese-related sulfurtransferase
VLDVRTATEYRDHRLEGSVHVPLGTLRGRLDRIARDREIVTVCSHGIRSYEAHRILVECGYARSAMLDGGLSAWPFHLERID